MSVQHFLTLRDLSAESLRGIVDRAIQLKQQTKAGEIYEPLKNQTLAMIFSKSSTRTRVSFEVAMRQLGGGALNLSPNDTQIGRGEPIEDTARVISSMCDAIMIRTDAHEKVERLAEYSSVPVINGLTDDFHPCQLLADIQTFQEAKGDISGKTIAWVGDGNNMCHSWMNAASLFGFTLNIACPEGYMPRADIIETNKAAINISSDPSGYCVNDDLMSKADKAAIFMHCLPAYRGMEVSNEVIEGAQSVVWQEAENRLHAQKALLEYLLVGKQ